jgi:tetratricopeptide (TPR) repeat protein/cellulose biosynthesis protein BcsQ
MQKAKTPGRIFTFYSYKGGTGRSMLVANTGWLLAAAGYHVLMVDWDLEAPGLHRYMAPFLTDRHMTDSNGLIDLVLSYAAEAVQPPETPRPPDWVQERADVLDYAVSINWKFTTGGSLSLLPAGRQGSAYATKVNSFSWQNFYDRLGGYGFFEVLKQSMRANFDFVLIDSRTGVSDTAGICTVQFPDSLVVCFTLNNQSIEGAAAVAQSVRQQKQDANFEIFPVPTRLDNSESDKLLQRWQLAKTRFAELLPKGQRPERYWDDFSVLYVPKFAYEEILAAFANRPDDPANLNLLAHARRLAEVMTGGSIAIQPIDETVRANVLAHFAGSDVGLSPMEAQARADEELARSEAEKKRLEAEQSLKIEKARTEGKQEAEEVLANERQRAKKQRTVAIAAIAAMLLLLLVIGGYQFRKNEVASQARDAVTLGDQARAEKRWDAALAEYNKAIEAIADDPTLFGRRAEVFVALEKPQDAIKDLDKAIAMSPDDIDLRTNRGRVRLESNDSAGAIEDFKLVLNRNPDSVAVMADLAEAFQKNNQLTDAVKTYSTVIERSPEDPNTLLRRADLYLKLKDRDAAIKDFRRVTSLVPDSPPAVFAQAELKALGVTASVTPTPVPVKTIVYLQYADDAGKEMIGALQAALREAELQPARSAELRSTGAPGVRYFHREDADRASIVKKVVERALAESRYLTTLPLVPLNARDYPKAPVGQIEVWLPRLGGYDIQQSIPSPAKRQE